ncbi:N-acetyltransferase 9 isoform X5 [Phocoena sinus]|uniref:N-acetyltransferase 9 isoform X5 n=1 Tax=Phocoena sinus TaxID=42100 RepID=UPI0013C4463C|nr:N-acetyltransferase 9 isoform X5 [Phocoena sinus]
MREGRPPARWESGAATMRLNQNILLLGKKVVLVPYTPEHVPRYHEWMKSEELRRLTASEPLTLEQEYVMQCSWQEDADKPSCRGQGLGTEAVLVMMSYGVTKLGLTKFEAKIGQGNEPSMQLFRKLHFEQVAVSSVFQEVTLRLTMSERERQWLLEQTSHVEEKPYRAGESERC